MMKKKLITFLCALTVFLLAGCLYPDDKRAENQVPYADQLVSVQQAVDQFYSDTGVLPIQTRDQSVIVYQRYPVDFRQLVPRYMQQPPGNSFESGGIYQYVLFNVEEEPEVKLIDLRSQREMNQVQRKLNDYMRRHTYAPVKDILDVGLFSLDYEKLGYNEEPLVPSPYSDIYLPLIFTNTGEVMIDYRLELNRVLQQNEGNVEYRPGEDIRDLLLEDSPFVPAYSIPYTIDSKGEPIYDMSLPNQYELGESE